MEWCDALDKNVLVGSCDEKWMHWQGDISSSKEENSNKDPRHERISRWTLIWIYYQERFKGWPFGLKWQTIYHFKESFFEFSLFLQSLLVFLFEADWWTIAFDSGLDVLCIDCILLLLNV